MNFGQAKFWNIVTEVSGISSEPRDTDETLLCL